MKEELDKLKSQLYNTLYVLKSVRDTLIDRDESDGLIEYIDTELQDNDLSLEDF